MKVVLFCHSLLSDWNHDNAHFLRGVVTELVLRGHDVTTFEPRNAWSVENVLEERPTALAETRRIYPHLDIVAYDPSALAIDEALDGADLVLVHEWNPVDLVRAIGTRRLAGGSFTLLYYDTHHRAVTAPETMCVDALEGYDGVLACGEALREVYVNRGWGGRVWVWHEAADTRVFRPIPGIEEYGDLVWIAKWGDEERSAELQPLLLEPVRALRLRARVHGVRYPAAARAALADAGIEYGGWLPSFDIPLAFARHRVTVHLPRRPGIPTIRPFEALACGIPLVSTHWCDEEGLFRPGDFVRVEDADQMTRALRAILSDGAMAHELARRGLETIYARHTCVHRVDELIRIGSGLGDLGDLGDVPSTKRSEVSREVRP